nr:60S ribosomal protein L3 [Ipomoea batatas]
MEFQFQHPSTQQISGYYNHSPYFSAANLTNLPATQLPLSCRRRTLIFIAITSCTSDKQREARLPESPMMNSSSPSPRALLRVQKFNQRRKRASRQRGKVKAFPKLIAFLGYKVGMTHIVKEVEKPGYKLHRKETFEAHGTKDIEAQLEKMKKYAGVIRVLVHTQKVDYAYGFFEKHVPVDAIFQKDEMIYIIGVTRLARKTHRGLRKVACIGVWHPARVSYTVACAGLRKTSLPWVIFRREDATNKKITDGVGLGSSASLGAFSLFAGLAIGGSALTFSVHVGSECYLFSSSSSSSQPIPSSSLDLRPTLAYYAAVAGVAADGQASSWRCRSTSSSGGERASSDGGCRFLRLPAAVSEVQATAVCRSTSFQQAMTTTWSFRPPSSCLDLQFPAVRSDISSGWANLWQRQYVSKGAISLLARSPEPRIYQGQASIFSALKELKDVLTQLGVSKARKEVCNCLQSGLTNLKVLQILIQQGNWIMVLLLSCKIDALSIFGSELFYVSNCFLADSAFKFGIILQDVDPCEDLTDEDIRTAHTKCNSKVMSHHKLSILIVVPFNFSLVIIHLLMADEDRL